MKRFVVLALVLGACVPDLDIDESVLTTPHVLAIRATPAEAAPGTSVTFEALYADASGQITAAPIEWAFCTARRRLAELGSVSDACLAWESEDLTVLGTGGSASGTVPRDACRLFGPEPPPAEPGEPAGRITEPDPTGGYFLPVRAIEPDDDALVFGAVRLSCGVAGATQDVAAELRRRYRTNEAPSIVEVRATREGGATEIVTGTLATAPGERVEIEVAWAECPALDVCGDGICGVDELREDCASDCTAPRGCGGAERYLRFDASSGSIVTQREAMRARWTTTSGRFETERNGRASEESATSLASTWVAPEVGAGGAIFVILRDERGGVGWAEIEVAITP